jgi:hypothetical protein
MGFTPLAQGRDVYATEAAESGDLLLNGNSLNEAAT